MPALDIIERLKLLSRGDNLDLADLVCGDAISEIARLRVFAGWVDTWISNPARSYSHDALEGLFGMTRDRLNDLNQQETKT